MEEGFNVKVLEYDDLQYDALTYWGWGETSVRLPSDRTCAEVLDGPCRSYHLGRPMTLQQLQTMPEDLQRMYLRKLRRKGGSLEGVGKMLGAAPGRFDTLGVQFDMPNPTAWAAFVSQC